MRGISDLERHGADLACRGTPTGAVTFTHGATTLGTATLTGKRPDTATLTIHALRAGSDHITAIYDGSATYAASAASAPITVDVAATKPAALGTVTATAGNASATVAFTRPPTPAAAPSPPTR